MRPIDPNAFTLLINNKRIVALKFWKQITSLGLGKYSYQVFGHGPQSIDATSHSESKYRSHDA
jgi:hypothetical protein